MTSAILLAAMLQLTAPGEPRGDLTRAYRVWIGVSEGRCSYRLGDVGLDARQLTEALKSGYETARGLELLTGPDLTYRCLRDARAAARRAGFTRVRARPGTDADREGGVP